MIVCDTCGSVEFEKYDGYMYCQVCQTQSQDFHEQDYEFRGVDSMSREKTGKYKTQEKVKEPDEGIYTSWEALNFILYGMTQELRNAFSLPYKFQFLVLKLWACYLKASNIGFISVHKEAFPKLQFNFRHRDARILFNFNPDKYTKKKKKEKKKASSNTSILSQSRRSLALKRRKIIINEYKELLSTSIASNVDLNNETLESLGRSRVTEFDNEREKNNDDATQTEELMIKCFEKLFNPSDLRMYKSVFRSERSKIKARDQVFKCIKYPAKTRLLSILHLTLLMTGSDIQLSDLLRLIRESHLSYAKVTQFLPKEMKFGRNDISYIDVLSDYFMPTHLNQRKIVSRLGYLLEIKKIELPDMGSLVRRYCFDLNLPDQIADLSIKMLSTWIPTSVVPKANSSLPSFEAWAMVSIIFVLKLLFGFNDQTEQFLSDLAKRLNSHMKDSKGNENHPRFFVFEDWQKFIECRKTILTEFHYPTQEQLDEDDLTTPKKFIHAVMKESKDEHRSQRFIQSCKHHFDDRVLGSVKSMVDELIRPLTLDSIEFEPSLTPQTSYLEKILSNSTLKDCDTKKFIFPKEILCRSFRDCSMDFALDPNSFFLLENDTGDSNTNLKDYGDLLNSLTSTFQMSVNEILKKCSSQYWTFHDTDSSRNKLMNFYEKIFEKTPFNFRWLIQECARMLEMNIRDVYKELVALEKCVLARVKYFDSLNLPKSQSP